MISHGIPARHKPNGNRKEGAWLSSVCQTALAAAPAQNEREAEPDQNGSISHLLGTCENDNTGQSSEDSGFVMGKLRTGWNLSSKNTPLFF